MPLPVTSLPVNSCSVAFPVIVPFPVIVAVPGILMSLETVMVPEARSSLRPMRTTLACKKLRSPEVRLRPGAGGAPGTAGGAPRSIVRPAVAFSIVIVLAVKLSA